MKIDVEEIMTVSALVFLADGFEELEAVSCIDILRRAGVIVTVVGIESLEVVSARSVRLTADVLLSELPLEPVSCLVFPGGLLGVEAFCKSEPLKQFSLWQYQQGTLMAAICAAPLFLFQLGILEGVPITVYPDVKVRLEGAVFSSDSVVHSGRIVTAKGAGVSLDFAYYLVSLLVSFETTKRIQKSMLYTM